MKDKYIIHYEDGDSKPICGVKLSQTNYDSATCAKKDVDCMKCKLILSIEQSYKFVSK
jgi:hypothetical protein